MPISLPELTRPEFVAMTRTVNDNPVAYLDGPAGSQVPRSVAAAVHTYLGATNANRGAPFATARESDAIIDDAHATLASFLGSNDPGTIVFGANMTSLTLHLSRSLARSWSAGDEIIVTNLDHDANVSPWTSAMKPGMKAHHVPVNGEDCTLRLPQFLEMLSERTKLVAVGYASNLAGTINPLREIIDASHAVGAKVFVDAVHYAPHGLIDVAELDCDFLAVSAYKFFGPHIGILYGKRSLLEEYEPYKLEPAPESLPGRWMTGTQNHEGIAGAAEAVRYLASIGSAVSTETPVETLPPNNHGLPSPSAWRPLEGATQTQLREHLVAAFDAIRTHEDLLASEFLSGLSELRAYKLWGIADPARLSERVPTFSLTHDTRSPYEIASDLADEGLFLWPGNHYALPLTRALHLEPQGTLRAGFLHYTTREEVQRLLGALARYG